MYLFIRRPSIPCAAKTVAPTRPMATCGYR